MRSFVREAARAGGGPTPDEGRVDELELAVNEAASNIMIHAYGGRPGRTIRARADLDDGEGRLVVRLSHDGATFDEAAVRAPDFDGSREGGFGVYLIRRCVDAVFYAQGGDGLRHITLTKSLRNPANR